jgi:hypothetical protein
MWLGGGWWSVSVFCRHSWSIPLLWGSLGEWGRRVEGGGRGGKRGGRVGKMVRREGGWDGMVEG